MAENHRVSSKTGGEVHDDSETMNAVVLHGADDMQVERRPVPQPGHGEVVLKVEVASICGTDVKVLHRTLQDSPPGNLSWAMNMPAPSRRWTGRR